MRQAHTARHRAVRRAPLRSMLTVTTAAAGATLIGLGAAGTTLALWQDSDLLNAAPISSGTLNLTVENESDTYDLAGDWNRMLPGDSYTEEVDVATPGDVDSIVAVTVTASSNFVVRAQKGHCPLSDPLPPTPAQLGTWLANESSPVCIEVTVAATAVEGVTENVDIDFVATQKSS